MIFIICLDLFRSSETVGLDAWLVRSHILRSEKLVDREEENELTWQGTYCIVTLDTCSGNDVYLFTPQCFCPSDHVMLGS